MDRCSGQAIACRDRVLVKGSFVLSRHRGVGLRVVVLEGAAVLVGLYNTRKLQAKRHWVSDI